MCIRDSIIKAPSTKNFAAVQRTVSYTHLDVYKRQGEKKTVFVIKEKYRPSLVSTQHVQKYPPQTLTPINKHLMYETVVRQTQTCFKLDQNVSN